MTTINEDYVSFEVAKLLKEKGFNERLLTFYLTTEDKKEGYFQIMAFTDDKIDNNHSDYCYLAPTLQMTMKWLRIEHNIHIEPHIVRTKCSYGYMPNYIDLKELKPHFPFDEFDFSNADKYVCITYDKACEITIRYCLENII